MSKIKNLVIDQLNKKKEQIEAEAEDIREKYPEIAKMTVTEVVATNLFVLGLRKAIMNYKISNGSQYYAFRSLKQNNTFEPENFRKEYIACMDKESKLPVAKRSIVFAIGDDAYIRTVKQMMHNYDAIQSGEATENFKIRVEKQLETLKSEWRSNWKL